MLLFFMIIDYAFLLKERIYFLNHFDRGLDCASTTKE